MNRLFLFSNNFCDNCRLTSLFILMFCSIQMSINIDVLNNDMAKPGELTEDKKGNFFVEFHK